MEHGGSLREGAREGAREGERGGREETLKRGTGKRGSVME